MEKEDALAQYNEEIRLAGEIAYKQVKSLNLPKVLDLPEEISMLGKKISSAYSKAYSELDDENGDALPCIMGAAIHEYWFACWNGAGFIQACIDDKSMLDNELTRKLATAQGYADHDGWAHTLANGFAALNPSEIRKKCIKDLTGLNILNSETTKKCMGLYWLSEADKEMQSGHVGIACDLIHEANVIFLSQTVDNVWEDAWGEALKEGGEISATKVRSELAKKAANCAHEESRAMKKEVQDFWTFNIDASLSNEAAARILDRQFPLTVRTLSQYVSDFKRAPR